MRSWFALSALVGLLLPASFGEASFVRDVVKNPSKEQLRNSELLSKAVPLDEYRETLRRRGLHLPMDEEETADRRLEMNYYNYGGKYYYYSKYKSQQAQDNNGDDNNNNVQADDDYYIADSYGFAGYSLKYAKCQPVQRFSEAAVQAGEYSPMVVNDIVILRLCPSSYCSSTRAYGCYKDFAEYAIELTDYIRIMLKYKSDKESQLCDWCQSCLGRRERRRTGQTYYYYSSNGSSSTTTTSSNYYGAGYDDSAGDDSAANDDQVEVNDEAVVNDECTDYDTYCLGEDGSAICDGGDDAVVDDAVAAQVTYLTADGYLDVIDCTQVNGGYFIRPRCDGYTEALSMGIYHDKFCSHYAGDQVNIEDLGMGIDQNYFKEFGSDAGCIDCSESDVPPYFTASSDLCIRVDVYSARCASGIQSDTLFSNTSNDTDDIECSYIESIRFGTYDANGQLYNEGRFGVNRQVTETQKYLLGVSLGICCILAVYSCYLHHAITNLLIKSLSHTDLLPPSRHRRRSGSSRRRGTGRRTRKPLSDEDDEDENFEIQPGATPA